MKNHGGKRRRSGRKPSGKVIVRISITLPHSLLADLKKLSRGWGTNRSQAVVKAIQIVTGKEPFLKAAPVATKSWRDEEIGYRRGKVSANDLLEMKGRLLQGETMAQICRDRRFADERGRHLNPNSTYLIRALAGIIAPDSADGSKTIIRTVECPVCCKKFNFEPFEHL